MRKTDFIVFGIWVLLALGAFISAFWIPVSLARTLSIIFGIFNMMIILSWSVSTIKAIKELKKNKLEKIDE